MSVTKRAFLIWFVGGLLAFAFALFLHSPLIIGPVPSGILDHQAARDAATVDRIHAAWEAAGVYTQAHWAMVSDLIFIGIYGTGCVLAGLYYRSNPRPSLRILGWIALVSGVVFLLTDYAETLSQFMQLVQRRGSDTLTFVASTCQPIKMASWIAAFVAVIAALLVERFSRRDA